MGSVMVSTAALSGCLTTHEQETQIAPVVARSYLEDKPEVLRPYLMVLMRQGPRNQVLNDMRIGLAAMEMGAAPLASELFDDALIRIEAVYADNPAAEQARSLWAKEAVKDFKGEPYERAMAYYYRGLLYMRAGDYENARASFKGGVLQAALGEQERYPVTFSLLVFLEAWASHCNGDDGLATETFHEFARINPKFPPPTKQADALILIETGAGPVKYADNRGVQRMLKFQNGGPAEIPQLILPATGKAPGTPPPVVIPSLFDDLYVQASTRGGREMDGIVSGKAQFKGGANTIGDALLGGGMIAATIGGNRNESYVSAGMLLAGLMAKGVSSAVEAEIDTRYWDNLPGQIYGMTTTLPASAALSVAFRDLSGGNIALSRRVDLVSAGRCRLGWVRTRPALPHSPRAPNSVDFDQMHNPVPLPDMARGHSRPGDAPRPSP
ncbi:MAG: hypothetical protein HQL37_01835 [Alphaproteobacteria bacterium]|nr:hypothetical protein [Alphaproteobacteria bacterium]